MNQGGAAIAPSARVHPTADVEDGVAIGAGTSVWHGAQIRRNARIGAECVIGRGAFIDEGVEIGDRVKIQNLALVYHGVTIEDGVFVGPGAILTNDRFPRAITTDGELATAEDWTVSPIILRHGCSIGAGAVVIAGVDVGSFATVGAGAVVTRTVATHALVVGNPARRIGWVCACGGRLEMGGRKAPADATPNARIDCPKCGRVYSYHGDPEGLAELRAERSAVGAAS